MPNNGRAKTLMRCVNQAFGLVGYKLGLRAANYASSDLRTHSGTLSNPNCVQVEQGKIQNFPKF